MLAEIKYIITRKRFWGSCLVLLFCLSGYAIFDWILLSHYPINSRPSALEQTIGGIFFGGVSIILPLCVSFPIGLYQVEEEATSFTDLKLIRSSLFKYINQKIISSFICGAILICISFSTHALFWNIVATPCDTNKYPERAIMFSPDCLYYVWQPFFYSLPIYISILLGMSFCGGVWAIVSETAAILFHDRILVISIPFCLFYLWHSGLPSLLFNNPSFPHPADLFNDAITWQSILASIFVYIFIIFVCILLNIFTIKRRIIE